jgi:sigma-B regulation protein RsbU (phosphoserine phosphatase)
MFGTQRLIDVVKANLDKSAGEIADEIMKEVGQFQGGVDRFDDETVVVLKVREAV